MHPLTQNVYPARTWAEVAEEFNRKHHTRLSRCRVCTIGKLAMEKIAQRLDLTEADVFDGRRSTRGVQS